MRRIGIIGFGRFGQLWASILAKDFSVLVYDHNTDTTAKTCNIPGASAATLEEVFRVDTVFYCVPISEFKSALVSHLQLLENSNRPLIVDMLSVKIHPQQIMKQHLPPAQEALLMHPMFGPDGVQASGLEGQRIVVDQFRTTEKHYQFWLAYFRRRKLTVIEMTAKEHDQLAAESQGLVHFLGRTLARFGLESTAIDTLNADKLQEITQSVNKDSWQLFTDLQTYNPYMPEVWQRLERAQKSIIRDLEKEMQTCAV